MSKNRCVLGVLTLAVGLVVGCPVEAPDGEEPTPCSSDGTCQDDGLFCNGAEVCDLEAGLCVHGGDPCPTSSTCDEQSDGCACDADPDCDDSVFCNGAEGCVGGLCAPGDSPCIPAELCDEGTAQCVECLADEDCQDDTAFGICAEGQCVECLVDDDCEEQEACEEGTCVSTCTCATDEDCDDGHFCTGVETCVDCQCIEGEDPCDPDEECDELLDVCARICSNDDDCPDDGVWCNGTEYCDADTGLCYSSGSPCAPGSDICGQEVWCNEEGKECYYSEVGQAYLTPETDTISCSGGNMSFYAGLHEEPGGTFINTLNDGDSIEAEIAGYESDTLHAQFTATSALTITPALLTAIDWFDLENTVGYPVTLDMINADTAETIHNNSANVDGGDLLITNLAVAPTDFRWSNGTERFTVTHTAAALSGTDDTTTLTVNNVVDVDDEAILTLQPAAAGSGYETLNIDSTGDVVNVLRQITGGYGTSLTTVNISGEAGLTVEQAFDSSLTTIDASTSTGDVTIAVTSTGVDTICSGGSGDDTFDYSGAANNYSTSDTINGGEGTDTLVLDGGDAPVTTTRSKVSNIETIKVSTSMEGDINVTYFGASNFTAAADLGADRRITVVDGATYTAEAATGANQLTIACSTGSYSYGETLTIDAKVNAANDFGGAVVLTDWEYVTLNAYTDAVEFGSTVELNDCAAAEILTLAGDQAITFGGAVTCDNLDASGLTGVLTLGAAMSAQCMVTGGSADDTILGSTSADILIGGNGDDTIIGDDGGDRITGGTGSDTIKYEAADDGGESDAGSTTGADILDDFTAGADGDVISLNGDIFKDPDAAANVVTTIRLQSITCAADGTGASGLVDPGAAATLPIVVVNTTLADWAALETLCETTIGDVFGATNDAALVIVNVTGIGQIAVWDPDSDTNNNLLVLAAFDPMITLSSLVAANFDEHDNYSAFGESVALNTGSLSGQTHTRMLHLNRACSSPCF